MTFGPKNLDSNVFHGGQLFMGVNDPAKFLIGNDQKDEHTEKHDRSLESIRIHDALQTAHDDIDGNNNCHEKQGDVIVNCQDLGNKLCPAHQDNTGIKRHGQKDQGPGSTLKSTRIKSQAEKLRKGVGIHVQPHYPCSSSEEYKGDKYTDKNGQKRQPEQAHPKNCCSTAETDDGRGADERGTIGHCHDKGMDLSAPNQKIGSIMCIPVGLYGQQTDNEQVDKDNGSE